MPGKAQIMKQLRIRRNRSRETFRDIRTRHYRVIVVPAESEKTEDTQDTEHRNNVIDCAICNTSPGAGTQM